MLFVVSPRYWYRILSWSEKRDRAGLAGWIGFGFLLHCGKVSLLLIDGEVSIGIAWPHQSVDYLIVASNTHTHTHTPLHECLDLDLVNDRQLHAELLTKTMGHGTSQ